MSDIEKIQIMVDDNMQIRDVDFSSTTFVTDGGRRVKKTVSYPVIDSSSEYIYENADGVRVYSIGWGCSPVVNA
jgi:hypothetical protein